MTGVDFAEAQLDRARRRVPGAEFLCQDLTELNVPHASFDAAVSYYAIIHIPREEHPLVFGGLHRALKPGGLALLCIGGSDLPTDVDDDHGVPMFWSHFAPDEGLRQLRDSGFDIVWSKKVVDMTEPGAGHLFVLCQKP